MFNVNLSGWAVRGSDSRGGTGTGSRASSLGHGARDRERGRRRGRSREGGGCRWRPVIGPSTAATAARVFATGIDGLCAMAGADAVAARGGARRTASFEVAPAPPRPARVLARVPAPSAHHHSDVPGVVRRRVGRTIPWHDGGDEGHRWVGPRRRPDRVLRRRPRASPSHPPG